MSHYLVYDEFFVILFCGEPYKLRLSEDGDPVILCHIILYFLQAPLLTSFRVSPNASSHMIH